MLKFIGTILQFSKDNKQNLINKVARSNKFTVSQFINEVLSMSIY